jgi:hypothetical protein
MHSEGAALRRHCDGDELKAKALIECGEPAWRVGGITLLLIT